KNEPGFRDAGLRGPLILVLRPARPGDPGRHAQQSHTPTVGTLAKRCRCRCPCLPHRSTSVPLERVRWPGCCVARSATHAPAFCAGPWFPLWVPVDGQKVLDTYSPVTAANRHPWPAPCERRNPGLCFHVRWDPTLRLSRGST